ncbi:hypothetical protein Gpo141_00005003 [Globisporangium polare]
MQSGFGSDFIRTPASESAHTSLFGVHWDNMEVDARTGRVHCRACELYAREVKQYQDKVASMIAQWKSAVRAELPRWKARGMHQMEIDKLTYEMREEMIPYTGFYNSNIARRHGDIIIQHVCAHWPSLAHLQIETLGCKDASQLLMALTADIRKQCHHFAKLKHAMAHAFPAASGARNDGGDVSDGVRRMQYKLGDPWAYLNMWQEEVTTELVAGVSGAGFLCGFLLIEKNE